MRIERDTALIPDEGIGRMTPSVIEEWRDVKGYGGRYLVSDRGRVARVTPSGLRRILSEDETGRNVRYARVCLYDGAGFRVRIVVHRLVFEAFVGPIPEGFYIDHIDRDPKNNALSNLRMVTQKENCANRKPRGA